MKEFSLYSEKKIHNIIKEMFLNFKIHSISAEQIKQNNLKNQNLLLILEGELLKNLSRSLFFNNNIVIFYETNKVLDNKLYSNVKFFTKHININKFIDEVTTYFDGNVSDFGDIKILGEKIINKNTQKEIFLTTLEKDILIALIEKKQAERNFLLEGVLKIKKDTETKTIESHLTRIRKKLTSINSQVEIISKENMVFLVF